MKWLFFRTTYSTIIAMKAITAGEIDSRFRRRDNRQNKYDFGRLVIACGSEGMAGAAVLCARAALRVGVGLATFYVSASIIPILQVSVPEATCVDIHGQGNILSGSSTSSYRSFAVGCGMGVTAEAADTLAKLLAVKEGTMVLDADGINLLAQKTFGQGQLLQAFAASPLAKVITPHEREAARLLGVSHIDNREQAALNLAKLTDAVAVLKGHHTIVATPSGETWYNTSGNPGMAAGGMGDVLTGIIGGLLAQGLPALEAAKTGVFIHGVAADLAVLDLGQVSLMAGDVPSYLPQAIRSLS